MNKEDCSGKFEVSSKQIGIIVTNISEEDKLYDDSVKKWGKGMNDGSGRSCLEKVDDALKQNPEIGKAIFKVEERFEKEEQILSPEENALADKNWQRIKKS